MYAVEMTLGSQVLEIHPAESLGEALQIAGDWTAMVETEFKILLRPSSYHDHELVLDVVGPPADTGRVHIRVRSPR